MTATVMPTLAPRLMAGVMLESGVAAELEVEGGAGEEAELAATVGSGLEE